MNAVADAERIVREEASRLVAVCSTCGARFVPWAPGLTAHDVVFGHAPTLPQGVEA